MLRAEARRDLREYSHRGEEISTVPPRALNRHGEHPEFFSTVELGNLFCHVAVENLRRRPQERLTPRLTPRSRGSRLYRVLEMRDPRGDQPWVNDLLRTYNVSLAC